MLLLENDRLKVVRRKRMEQGGAICKHNSLVEFLYFLITSNVKVQLLYKLKSLKIYEETGRISTRAEFFYFSFNSDISKFQHSNSPFSFFSFSFIFNYSLFTNSIKLQKKFSLLYQKHFLKLRVTKLINLTLFLFVFISLQKFIKEDSHFFFESLNFKRLKLL